MDRDLRQNQTGHDLVKTIVKTIRTSKIKITRKWAHSHQNIQSKGEWINNKDDRLERYYMNQYKNFTTPQIIKISPTDIQLSINHDIIDNNIL